MRLRFGLRRWLGVIALGEAHLVWFRAMVELPYSPGRWLKRARAREVFGFAYERSEDGS